LRFYLHSGKYPSDLYTEGTPPFLIGKKRLTPPYELTFFPASRVYLFQKYFLVTLTEGYGISPPFPFTLVTDVVEQFPANTLRTYCSSPPASSYLKTSSQRSPCSSQQRAVNFDIPPPSKTLPFPSPPFSVVIGYSLRGFSFWSKNNHRVRVLYSPLPFKSKIAPPPKLCAISPSPPPFCEFFLLKTLWLGVFYFPPPQQAFPPFYFWSSGNTLFYFLD